MQWILNLFWHWNAAYVYYCIELITPQYKMAIIVILTYLILWEKTITSKSCRRCEKLYFSISHILKLQTIQDPFSTFYFLILEYVLYVAISPSWGCRIKITVCLNYSSNYTISPFVVLTWHLIFLFLKYFLWSHFHLMWESLNNYLT